MTETEVRTPMFRMSDEQLRCYALDELMNPGKRRLATSILRERGVTVAPPSDGPVVHHRGGSKGRR